MGALTMEDDHPRHVVLVPVAPEAAHPMTPHRPIIHRVVVTRADGIWGVDRQRMSKKPGYALASCSGASTDADSVGLCGAWTLFSFIYIDNPRLLPVDMDYAIMEPEDIRRLDCAT